MGAENVNEAVPEELFARIEALMAEREFNADRINALTSVLDEARSLPCSVTTALADRLRARGDPDFVRLHSTLGHITGDPHEYERIINWLTLVMPQMNPAVSHFIYWGVLSRVFAGGLKGPKAAGFAECDLFRFHQTFTAFIKDRFGINPTRRTAHPGPVRRVALVTNQFLGDRHQPTRDVFDYAWRLRSERGVDAVIFNANLMPRRVEALFFPPLIADMVEGYEGSRNMLMWGREAPVVSFTEREFGAAKLRSIVAEIEGFDPDAIVAFGGTNIVADLFVGSRPTVCLPTTSHVTLTLADLLLGYDGSDWTIGLHELYREPFARRFRPFTLGFAIPPTDPENAEDFGLADAPFVFVVVGTRLDAEADEAFIALADDVLDTRPDAVLAFAGWAPGLAGRVSRARNAARMRLLDHVGDIRALYRRCGAFLNPPRQGGGGSAGFAMAEGVPIVTFAGGDVGGVAGPAFHAVTRSDYVAAAGRLANDAGYQATMSAAATGRYAEIGDRSRFTKRLLDYCEEAREAYRAD